jgi:methyl-accepting chemotaxis protein
VIIGQEPADFGKLVADGQDIAKQLKEISTNINERLQTNKDNVDQILTDLNKTMGHLSSIVGNADQRLDVNSAKIDEIVDNMAKLSKNLEELSYDLKLHPWKLLHKSKEKPAEVK